MSVCKINLDELLEWKDWCLTHEITYQEAILIFEGKLIQLVID